ncbi:calcofluor white hypersensitive protein [Neofusicoccum parvum]|uniref:Calcofluor white hypersensitive protein n=2 Tax=Neofusicoccum TaxID=407951 RepID=A0ABR3SHU0_9PEZI|nr:putative calcofluor white hypersensitive protein [Neofusicoccum parvum UCRNP2]GME52905.1 calcofluor white hypersensitive protein [Neofusicoccum parvum]
MAARGGSRLGLYGGLAAAGGVGYYLYQAGGNPKLAEKELEHDASRLSSKIKGELPGKEKEVKTSAKVLGEEAGDKVDGVIADAKATASKIDAKLEAYRAQADKKIGDLSSQTAKDAHSAVDKFDKTVEEKAAQSKSWLSGWFK